MSSLGPESIAKIILTLVVGFLIYIMVSRFLFGFGTSFQSSVCKFSSYLRSSIFGNPFMQLIISQGQYLFGGFSGYVGTTIGVPLACPQFSQLTEENLDLKTIVNKISYDSLKCWDQFGYGAWDPLAFSNYGQSFTCFEQILNITCTKDDITNLWSEETDFLKNYDSNIFSKAVFDYYLKTHDVVLAGLNKTFYSAFLYSPPVFDGAIICDGKEHQYLISINFVDYFTVIRNVASVPLVCNNVILKDLKTDVIYICVIELGGKEGV